ncbi:MAG: tRNA (adenosine(37)-N6)-dimethylallyltransferase MiaA [Bacteroidetes bacterium GWF2_43_63]|nr:MAG: tRNA (adenosine(37)-N6)-dimethylallyltransferase MiaA [Bacteroidetes bacterium GWE2_42_42]OFY55078.1 MAG: tRNA (adenosine(37)-N6)-dimethylallyltransferase MiaA [Bacteroidetes bacterium GWF2_43_63]HBG69615.1 tRNA (adenosine(37)-N6)-dimethylallyltransferase MiaA [Bacteroidales bacterium]HCB60646.1 tRNA (adenosine(37)-N6)-dimethylallyltransferase MiaA [Bacteroidales bacterium]HCY24050.1 tRNA (adenosine(37)-N6)-dimethylallyltransferase MiaA [Bacteroidales bacterium]
MEIHELMVILGPTATGKTALAVKAARTMNAEIVSADSRQIYRGLDIGTGKDLSEYSEGGTAIPYHLIDFLNPGESYNTFQFKADATGVISEIESRGKLPLVCGGTGLYIESLLLDYHFSTATRQEDFRREAEHMENSVLARQIEVLGGELSKEDKGNRHRLVRKLEVMLFSEEKKEIRESLKIEKLHVFGIDLPREIIRKRITDRLIFRLENGMVEEVKALLDAGVSPKWLDALGLEYRFVSRYLKKQMSYQEMFMQLETAIHQFAKRQSTWFRRMEKRGIKINWIDGQADDSEKMEFIMETVDFNL